MKTENKLKELAAAESAFNEANNSQGAAWEVYKDAEKVYGDPLAAEEVYDDSHVINKFISSARDAARSDYIAAGEALLAASDSRAAASNAYNSAVILSTATTD